MGMRVDRRGWRKTAIINTALVAALTLTLAILVGVITSNSGSLTRNLFFYQGPCDTSTKINVALHLVINIIAMGVVASSNFFIQVLNAPSRGELDVAHRKKKMLDIGVHSAKNMWHISRFKLVSILVFGLSSLPIHLLFNSVVFQSDFLGGKWQMTFAAEPFVNGSAYTLPGAYLAPSGFFPDYGVAWREYLPRAYTSSGTRVSISDYTNASSPIVASITRAAKSSSSWVRLDPRTCRRQYIACEPRRTYGDVVVIINTGNESHKRGWIREQLVNSSTFDQISAGFWEDLGLLPPADEVNPLWFSAVCKTTQNPMEPAGMCTTGCGSLIGAESRFTNMCPAPPGGENGPDPSGCAYSYLKNSTIFSSDGNWTIVNDEPKFYAQSTVSPSVLADTPIQRNTTLKLQHRAGFDVDGFSDWEVEYCLAEDISNRCRVGVSGVLLLVVTICAALKTMQCIVILLKLNDDPLVTPGDAIESFLLRPDPETRDMCTLSNHQLASFWGNDAEERIKGWPAPAPRKWRRPVARLFVAIMPGKWFRTYIFFISGIVVAGWFFSIAVVELAEKRSSGKGSDYRYSGLDHTYENGLFDANWVPKGQLLPSILISNAPQLILSINYFMYNAIWTRLHSELEWNAFAISYRPLRVTSPKGEQLSTYRLQLPYLYSIPLIIGSIVLHWLVSNAIYVLVIEGDYLTPTDNRNTSANLFINVGYSTGPMLAAITTCSVMAALPALFGLFYILRGNMPVMGNNSLIISASCHPARRATSSGGKMSRSSSIETLPGGKAAKELSLIVEERELGLSGGEGPSVRERSALSQGKLKWGAVGGDVEIVEEGPGITVSVGHLSFAGENEEVSLPEEGKSYR